MRVEEVYSIDIQDGDAGQVHKVEDLYHLICAELAVIPVTHPKTASELPLVAVSTHNFLGFRRSTPLPPPSQALPWTGQSVWDTLVAVLVDQQCLDADEVLPASRFGDDLGVD